MTLSRIWDVLQEVEEWRQQDQSRKNASDEKCSKVASSVSGGSGAASWWKKMTSEHRSEQRGDEDKYVSEKNFIDVNDRVQSVDSSSGIDGRVDVANGDFDGTGAWEAWGDPEGNLPRKTFTGTWSVSKAPNPPRFSSDSELTEEMMQGSPSSNQRKSSKKQNRWGGHDESIGSDDTSLCKHGGDDDLDVGNVDITGAEEACGQQLSSEFSGFLDDKSKKIAIMQGMTDFHLQKYPQNSGSNSNKYPGKVNSTNTYLPETRRTEDIAEGSSPNSKDDFWNLESKSKEHHAMISGPIPKKGGRFYGKESILEPARRRSTQQRSLSDQSKKQRLFFEDEDKNEGD